MLTLDSGTTFMGVSLVPRAGLGNCTNPFSTSQRNSDVDSAHFNLSELTTGDVDGDTDPDVLIGDASSTTGNIHVMPWLNGSSDFAGGIPPAAHPTSFASAGAVFALAVADFDRDGCPDIAAADVLPSFQDTVAIHAGHCNATQFDTAKTFDVAGDQNTFSDYPKLAVGDLNGDGKRTS